MNRISIYQLIKCVSSQSKATEYVSPQLLNSALQGFGRNSTVNILKRTSGVVFDCEGAEIQMDGCWMLQIESSSPQAAESVRL